MRHAAAERLFSAGAPPCVDARSRAVAARRGRRQGAQTVTRCPLSAACCLLHVVCCMLHVVCCMLPVACCLLHVVCCMLSVERRMWSVAHCPSQAREDDEKSKAAAAASASAAARRRSSLSGGAKVPANAYGAEGRRRYPFMLYRHKARPCRPSSRSSSLH